MRRLLAVPAALFLTACMSQTETDIEPYPYSHHSDDRMIGSIVSVDGEGVSVDISEWAQRQEEYPTEQGYAYLAEITEDTEIVFEDGQDAGRDDLKLRQKVLVNPPMKVENEGTAEEIVLLKMTDEEIYSPVYSHIDDKVNLVLLYEEGEPPSQEKDIETIMRQVEESIVAGSFPYEENDVADYKRTFGIDEFPFYIVADRENVLLTTSEASEVYVFFEEREE
ncbi:hypothetical protein [Alteribacter natronophilus]|uniref:hypothetical protein n=1 Tax=Alteribacter natronophilus TaxID=2583810 RepID=UPI00110F2657|nr:hypothetical protein [Alteribacter natronophilus]TMW72838.1 hypothetical protein FGB90_00555 [Alteribacter natronophilus]